MYNYIIFDIAVLSPLQKLLLEELNEKFSFKDLRFALSQDKRRRV